VVKIMLLFIFSVSSSSVQADPGTDPGIWKVPGSNPFTGTPIEACKLLSSISGIEFKSCLLGVKNYSKQGCRQGYLSDGDEIFVTFGKNKAKRMKVLFIDKVTRRPLSPYDRRRVAIVCNTGNKNFKLLFPVYCGNWAIKEVKDISYRYHSPNPKKTDSRKLESRKETCGFSDGKKVTVLPEYYVGGYGGFPWIFNSSGYVPAAIQQEFDYVCNLKNGGGK